MLLSEGVVCFLTAALPIASELFGVRRRLLRRAGLLQGGRRQTGSLTRRRHMFAWCLRLSGWRRQRRSWSNRRVILKRSPSHRLFAILVNVEILRRSI